MVLIKEGQILDIGVTGLEGFPEDHTEVRPREETIYILIKIGVHEHVLEILRAVEDNEVTVLDNTLSLPSKQDGIGDTIQETGEETAAVAALRRQKGDIENAVVVDGDTLILQLRTIVLHAIVPVTDADTHVDPAHEADLHITGSIKGGKRPETLPVEQDAAETVELPLKAYDAFWDLVKELGLEVFFLTVTVSTGIGHGGRESLDLELRTLERRILTLGGTPFQDLLQDSGDTGLHDIAATEPLKDPADGQVRHVLQLHVTVRLQEELPEGRATAFGTALVPPD